MRVRVQKRPHSLSPAIITHSATRRKETPSKLSSPHTFSHPQWPPFPVSLPSTLPRGRSCGRPATSHKPDMAACIAIFTSQQRSIANLPSPDLPPVKPSAIALGTAFNHAVSLAVLGPVFGDAYRRAQQANSKEEYFHSKEAATAAASWGSSIVGSAVQTYGVGALINATGTLTYKGAAYLGSLIFMASAAPSVRHLCLVSCHFPKC